MCTFELSVWSLRIWNVFLCGGRSLRRTLIDSRHGLIKMQPHTYDYHFSTNCYRRSRTRSLLLVSPSLFTFFCVSREWGKKLGNTINQVDMRENSTPLFEEYTRCAYNFFALWYLCWRMCLELLFNKRDTFNRSESIDTRKMPFTIIYYFASPSFFIYSFCHVQISCSEKKEMKILKDINLKSIMTYREEGQWHNEWSEIHINAIKIRQ